VGLSGGSTPKPIYQELSKQYEALKENWKRVIFFLIDERYIGVEDNRSNQKMISEALQSHGSSQPIIQDPSNQLIFPDTSLPLSECISEYQQKLRRVFSEKGSNNAADIVTLGMGNDGHIASLFPPLNPSDLPTHSAEDRQREVTVLHRQTDVFDVRDRITVDLTMIANSSLKVVFLKGYDKLAVWQQMMTDFTNRPENSTQHLLRWPVLNTIHLNLHAIFA
jgi:6-phosphogluconolactonase